MGRKVLISICKSVIPSEHSKSGMFAFKIRFLAAGAVSRDGNRQRSLESAQNRLVVSNIDSERETGF